jgi:ADP-heptose:LPS heptosyltransferase
MFKRENLKIKENKIHHILLIRSAKMGQFIQALKFLKDKFPKAKISLLIQPELKNTILNGDYERISFPKDGMFNIFRANFSFLKELIKREFDAVMLLYNNSDGTGYFHLKLLVHFFIRPKFIIIHDILGRKYLLPKNTFKIEVRKEILKKVFFPLIVLLVFQLIVTKSFYRIMISKLKREYANRC